MLNCIDPVDIEHCEMGTDSSYLVISGASSDARKKIWFPLFDTLEHKQHEKKSRRDIQTGVAWIRCRLFKL